MSIPELKRQGRARVIPAAWWNTPGWAGTRCEGVNIHWTAGAYAVSNLDRQHYHVILGGNGGPVVRGNQSPKSNESTTDGDSYAGHTRGLNTRRFGLSVACMASAVKGSAGRFPLLERDWERLAEAAAEVLDFYKLPLSVRTCIQHGEVQRQLGIAQRGKWDICWLPFDPGKSDVWVCDRFRERVAHYLAEYHGADAPEKDIRIFVGDREVEQPFAYQDAAGGVWVRLRGVIDLLPGWSIKKTDPPKALLQRGGNEVPVPFVIDERGRGFSPVGALCGALGLHKTWDPERREVRIG